MKELRPLGSEKLTGDAKIQRILEIANYGRTAKPSVNVDKPEYITESKSGGFYGIVKEKDGFYVKKGLTESSLEYIGGLYMKNKNRFSSYGEAFKRLDYLKGQENLQEATKYILKQTKSNPTPPMEAAPAEPSMSEVPPMDNAAPTGDMPPVGDETSPEGEPSPEGGEEQLRSSYMANIQKFAGKLGQELRDQKDKLESDDLKYVLNMIISAIDLDQLDDDDFEEIADKFDPEKRRSGEDDIPSIDDNMSASEPEPEQDVAEEENDTIYDYDNEEEIDEIMSSLEEFINTPVENDENSTESLFSKYSDLDGNDDEMMENDDISYLDARAKENEYPDDYDLSQMSDEDADAMERSQIDWESKLRGKSRKEEESEEVYPRRTTRRNTYPPTEKVVKPQLDIDEIAKAINQALSKYR